MRRPSNQLPYDGSRFGRERCDGPALPRHRHPFGYMCLILSGRFDEAGDEGRFRVGPGDVLIHRTYEAHRDIFEARGAEVLNLPLPDSFGASGRVRIEDADAVARAAERDPWDAAEQIAAGSRSAGGEEDWPDLLARDLRDNPQLALGDWARAQGLAPATVSRGFGQAYGVTPARYRAETRALRAWRSVSSSRQALAAIAFDLGFADQAHMTRAFVAMVGAPPHRWRTARQMSSRNPS
jgi:AraC-like DNA-binding protein